MATFRSEVGIACISLCYSFNLVEVVTIFMSDLCTGNDFFRNSLPETENSHSLDKSGHRRSIWVPKHNFSPSDFLWKFHNSESAETSSPLQGKFRLHIWKSSFTKKVVVHYYKHSRAVAMELKKNLDNVLRHRVLDLGLFYAG